MEESAFYPPSIGESPLCGNEWTILWKIRLSVTQSAFSSERYYSARAGRLRQFFLFFFFHFFLPSFFPLFLLSLRAAFFSPLNANLIRNLSNGTLKRANESERRSTRGFVYLIVGRFAHNSNHVPSRITASIFILPFTIVLFIIDPVALHIHCRCQ